MPDNVYSAIYLAPHLDDIPLSCGGQVHKRTQAGEKVLALTIMAGEPPPGPLSEFAQLLHGRWQLAADVVTRRRAEDVAACARLGVDWQHWPVPDCVYRQDEAGTWLYPEWTAVIDTIHPVDRTLINDLAARLRRLPPAKRIIAPLGVGGHVDHQITRLAAAKAFSHRLWYYEDYPYVAEPDALSAVIPPDSDDWQATAVALTDANIQAKIEAIAAYESQLSSFFNGRDDLVHKIHAAAQEAQGERLWQRP